METYEDYKRHIKEDVGKCLNDMKCQPILFIGSGFSQRYINAPNWKGLLEEIAEGCPSIDKNIDYYLQDENTLIEIGSFFAKFYKEWAWSSGKSSFPDDLFSGNYNFDIFIKYAVCEYLKNILSDDWLDQLDEKLKNEISILNKVSPHAIITTNYDCLIEEIFKGYEAIIGQKILRANTFSIGEIFKIHGSVSEPNFLVLTSNDYDIFRKRKKYLSAKLLAFFAEHPLLFVGYSATDPNIKEILADIDEIISDGKSIIPNIYILKFKKSIEKDSYPEREKIINLDDKRVVRIKAIVASEYDWVFESFISSKTMESIDPKLLRALLSKTYEFVTCDIPRKKLPCNFKMLQDAINSEDGLSTLFGLTAIGDPSQINLTHPYILKNVAKNIGYSSWHKADQLIEKIKNDTGIDIKSGNNKYHVAIEGGNNTNTIRKYSLDMILLLEKVRDELPYQVDM